MLPNRSPLLVVERSDIRDEEAGATRESAPSRGDRPGSFLWGIDAVGRRGIIEVTDDAARWRERLRQDASFHTLMPDG